MGTRFVNLGFQARLTLVAATAVAVAVAAAAVVIYFVAQWVVLGQLDESLQRRGEGAKIGHVRETVEAAGRPGTFVIGSTPVIVPPPDPGGPGGLVQAVLPDGTTRLPIGQEQHLPITSKDRAVGSGKAPPYWRTDRVGGVPYRIYTTRLWVDTYFVSFQIARPLTELNSTLNLFQLFLAGVVVAGVALAALLGWLIAKAGLRPIYRLRAAVDHVTVTGDMSQRVPYEGADELGLLGAHFNRMMGALDQSSHMQRQLVADASHELRTPLASLRTNVEVLQRSPHLAEPERIKLLEDVMSQIEQLTRLIGDLVDLARGDETPQKAEEVRLDWIVAEAVDRAATNWPAVRFDTELAESTVRGQARRLDRAISNLLDNAGKWSPEGGVVEVRVVDHEITVRDHGPGIDPADLPYVFDRFWRAPAARGMPGSGLGLSIVRQVAEAHHATVTAELPQDGGTLLRVEFSSS